MSQRIISAVRKHHTTIVLVGLIHVGKLRYVQVKQQTLIKEIIRVMALFFSLYSPGDHSHLPPR